MHVDWESNSNCIVIDEKTSKRYAKTAHNSKKEYQFKRKHDEYTYDVLQKENHEKTVIIMRT